MEKPVYFAVAAVSLDGFIARYPGHRSDWTSREDKAHLHKMEAQADVLLLGRTSFEIAKKHLKKKNCLILTSTVNKPLRKEKFLVYINPKKTNLKKFIEKLGYKKVCVLGGRGAYNYCLKHGLLDEIFLTIESIAFGSGIGMFDKKISPRKFELVSIKKLNKKGTVLLHYKKKLLKTQR